MVKYNIRRIEQQNKQYEDFCQRKKIRPGVYRRISWELLTRGIIPDDNFEPLNLSKLTLERIFIDLGINSLKHTGTPHTKVQTIEEIFHYAINHPKQRGKTPKKINDQEINRFLGNY